MSDLIKQVDVCIATFRRPQLLTGLLQSLAEQKLNSNIVVRVVVIDNDPDRGAEVVVEKKKENFPFEIHYESETRRGITFARNRALSCVTGQYLAFLDDDEFVEPNWLQLLLSTMDQYNADAVFGPVFGLLPEDAPIWAKSHPSFRLLNKDKLTGTRVFIGGTGNVLVKTIALGSPMMLFNHSFALTGGEDSEFFYRMHMAGRSLIWCNEAKAYEYISAERLSTEWVYRRAFRGGQCFMRLFVTNKSSFWKVVHAIRKTVEIVVGGAILPFLYVSYPMYVRLHSRLNSALGQLSILMGTKQLYKEYASPSYREIKPSTDRYSLPNSESDIHR